MNDASTLIWLVPVFLLLFVGMWVFVSKLLASLSGWCSLAASYGTSAAIDGHTFSSRSAKIGIVDYNGCLRFTAAPSTLSVAVMFPFRCGHRPLTVPWSDILATDHQGWIFRYVDFRFAKQPQIRLRVSHKLAEALIAAGGNAVSIAETA
jgi:hypothetical protein